MSKLLADSIKVQAFVTLLASPQITLPISLRKKILYKLLETIRIAPTEKEQAEIERWYSLEPMDPRREVQR
jgi:hypothetical protein